MKQLTFSGMEQSCSESMKLKSNEDQFIMAKPKSLEELTKFSVKNTEIRTKEELAAKYGGLPKLARNPDTDDSRAIEPEHPLGDEFEAVSSCIHNVYEELADRKKSNKAQKAEIFRLMDKCDALEKSIASKQKIESTDDARKDIRMAFDGAWDLWFGPETFQTIRHAFKKDLGL